MTFLQELIDGASGDMPVPTLLRKVKVLAARARSEPLAEWVEHELSGYPNTAQVPTYRGPFLTPVFGHLLDPLGRQVRNAPIARVGFPPEFREGPLFNTVLAQPISELDALAEAGSTTLELHWAGDYIAIVNSLVEQGKVHLQGGMYLAQAYQVISSALLKGVLGAARDRVLDLALAVEASSPDAGSPSGPPPEPQPIQTFINHIYGGGVANVAQASSGFQQHVAVDSKDQLFETLRVAGLDDDLLRDLDLAMSADDAADESEGNGMGPRVQSWLGALTVKAATTAGTGALNAVAGVAAKALARHYGIE